MCVTGQMNKYLTPPPLPPQPPPPGGSIFVLSLRSNMADQLAGVAARGGRTAAAQAVGNRLVGAEPDGARGIRF